MVHDYRDAHPHGPLCKREWTPPNVIGRSLNVTGAVRQMSLEELSNMFASPPRAFEFLHRAGCQRHRLNFRHHRPHPFHLCWIPAWKLRKLRDNSETFRRWGEPACLPMGVPWGCLRAYGRKHDYLAKRHQRERRTRIPLDPSWRVVETLGFRRGRARCHFKMAWSYSFVFSWVTVTIRTDQFGHRRRRCTWTCQEWTAPLGG
jgi:hypothetical protein